VSEMNNEHNQIRTADLLKTEWGTFQPKGVEINGHVYSGDIVRKYTNRKPRHRWPFKTDPHDVRWVYFQDPDDQKWHRLQWKHNRNRNLPFDRATLDHARLLASKVVSPSAPPSATRRQR